MSTTVIVTRQSTDWQEAALFVRNTLCFNTKRDYAAEVRLFAAWVKKPAHIVTLSDLLSYREHLEARNLKPATIAKKLTVLRRLFVFCHDQGLLPRNPAAGLALPKVNNESGRDILTLDECRRLLDAVDSSTLRGRRDRATLALLIINGLRVSEIVKANVSDLRQEEGYWVLRVHGKGGKDADTRIRDDVYGAIHAYLSLRGDVLPETPLFIGTNRTAHGRLSTRAVQYMVMRCMKKTGISRPNLCVHSLRHTAVTLVILSGASMPKAQDFARHASIATTQRYFHHFERMKDHAVLMHPLHLPEAASSAQS